jgi:hypothetical protein
MARILRQVVRPARLTKTVAQGDNRPMLLLVLCFAAGIAHEGMTTPDLSGRWTADAAPAARGDMGSGWGSPVTITQDADRLTVEYAFFARGDMQPPLKFVYALNGSATTNSVMMGRGVQTQSSTAKWSGDSLVITTVHTFPDPATGNAVPAEVTQTLTLESPTTLVVETKRAGVLGGPASISKTIYKKN